MATFHITCYMDYHFVNCCTNGAYWFLLSRISCIRYAIFFVDGYENVLKIIKNRVMQQMKKSLLLKLMTKTSIRHFVRTPFNLSVDVFSFSRSNGFNSFFYISFNGNIEGCLILPQFSTGPHLRCT